MANDVPNDATR